MPERKPAGRRFEKLSIEEPVSHLRHIPIVESGEPLIDWLDHPRIFQDRPRFNYHRETVARAHGIEQVDGQAAADANESARQGSAHGVPALPVYDQRIELDAQG